MLYKVCNSFVEMGSANVQATDYLKGVGQYFPALAGLLSPAPYCIRTEEAVGLPHSPL